MRKLENIFILPHLTVRSGPLSTLRLNTRTDNLILEIKRQTNIALYVSSYLVWNLILIQVTSLSYWGLMVLGHWSHLKADRDLIPWREFASAGLADCLLIPAIMIKFLTRYVVAAVLLGKLCIKGRLQLLEAPRLPITPVCPRLPITPLGQTTCVIYNWHCHLDGGKWTLAPNRWIHRCH